MRGVEKGVRVGRCWWGKPATMSAKIITIKKLTASAKNGAQIKKNKNPMEIALYKNVKMRQAWQKYNKKMEKKYKNEGKKTRYKKKTRTTKAQYSKTK